MAPGLSDDYQVLILIGGKEKRRAKIMDGEKAILLIFNTRYLVVKNGTYVRLV